MTALDHYDRLYGDMGLHPQDAARFVFISGWNTRNGRDAMKRVNKPCPSSNDTRAIVSPSISSQHDGQLGPDSDIQGTVIAMSPRIDITRMVATIAGLTVCRDEWVFGGNAMNVLPSLSVLTSAGQ